MFLSSTFESLDGSKLHTLIHMIMTEAAAVDKFDIYRAKLEKLMTKCKLTKEARFMVYFFASVMKSKDRIVTAMNTNEGVMKEASWFKSVLDFFRTKTVQYTKQETIDKKCLREPSISSLILILPKELQD